MLFEIHFKNGVLTSRTLSKFATGLTLSQKMFTHTRDFNHLTGGEGKGEKMVSNSYFTYRTTFALTSQRGEGKLPEHNGHIFLTWDSSSSNAYPTSLL